MKRPWQFWLVFAACVSIMFTAMGWLTSKALELDQAEAIARHRAELEQDISRALWRMDVTLIPLLAREAARPYFVYGPVFVPPTEEGQAATSSLRPSPLLLSRPDDVLLNFQCDSKELWTSPQAPKGKDRQIALQYGVSQEDMLVCSDRLTRLQQQTTYRQLADRLPTDALKTGVHDSTGASDDQLPQVAKVIKGTVDVDAIQRRLTRTPASSQRGNAATPDGEQNRASSNSSQVPERLREELETRNATVQAYAQNILAAERTTSFDRSSSIREGVSQPIWVGSDLLLARRVEFQDEVRIQGCWLDWPGIKSRLLADVRDLLPQVELEPVRDPTQVVFERMLATLPVQLVVPEAGGQPARWSAMRISLLAAWVCLLLAVLAVVLLSHGVLALSERRGAFVSSVTHELRTPLTTFRMYSEMLAGGMVPDADQRRQYLDTLRLEADRLSHLVENVLAYARLERGRPRRPPEHLAVDACLDRMERRLQERAQQAGMRLVVEANPETRRVRLATDPAALEQILFNLVDNACKYAAAADDPRIHLEVVEDSRRVHFRVRDHGRGIATRELRRLFRPFSKSADEAAQSAPGVGLGLALCRRLAFELGGRLRVEAPHRGGAVFVLVLPITSRRRVRFGRFGSFLLR